jgi:hypothetical protein
VFVKAKVADVVAPVVVAVTLYVPAVVPAVNVCEVVATPVESVVSVSVAPPVAKVPFGSAAGAVKVTETPLAGVPLEVTFACRAVPNAVPTCAIWGVPPVAVIAIVGGGVVWLELLQATRNAIMPKPRKRRIDLRNVIAHLR